MACPHLRSSGFALFAPTLRLALNAFCFIRLTRLLRALAPHHHRAIHEIGHLLGFSSAFCEKTPGYSFLGFSGSGHTMVQDAPSGLHKQIITPRVLAKGREFFDCASLTGVEIEDAGGGGTAGSHWESRILKNDVMSGAANANDKSYVRAFALPPPQPCHSPLLPPFEFLHPECVESSVFETRLARENAHTRGTAVIPW